MSDPQGSDPAVRVPRSATRCPYCHETAAPSATDVVVCADCLARHHRSCWREAPRCGTCGGGEALARFTSAEAQARPLEEVTAAAFAESVVRIGGTLGAAWLVLVFLVQLIKVSGESATLATWDAFLGSIVNVGAASLVFTLFVVGRSLTRWHSRRGEDADRHEAKRRAHLRRIHELLEREAEGHPDLERACADLTADMTDAPDVAGPKTQRRAVRA